MRVLAALAAVMLLAGCDDQAGKPGNSTGAFSSADTAEAFVKTGSGFDYRYAFRLPGDRDRVKAVLQSNANGCDSIGPAHCRITGMRYTVDGNNHIRAVLTLNIDPAIARQFGEAVVKTVQSADGVLVDSEISGADLTTSARTLAIIGRLRERLKAAQNAAATDPAAKAQADRIKNALDTIAESEAGQGQTLATAPVLLTYESSSALTGLGSADANFRNAGASFETTISRVLILLAAVGPWFLLLVALILILRFAVHGFGGGRAAEPEAGDDGYAAEHSNGRQDNRNLIQRWFNRDDDRAPEHQG